jgi:hypothetical protein
MRRRVQMLRLREQGSQLKGRIIRTGGGTQRRESGGSASAVPVDWRIQEYRGFIAFLQLMVSIVCVYYLCETKQNSSGKSMLPIALRQFKTLPSRPSTSPPTDPPATSPVSLPALAFLSAQNDNSKLTNRLPRLYMALLGRERSSQDSSQVRI